MALINCGLYAYNSQSISATLRKKGLVAWVRWVRAHKNGLTKEERETLLDLLRDCAWAEGGDEVNLMKVDEMYRKAVNRMKDSAVWKQHGND